MGESAAGIEKLRVTSSDGAASEIAVFARPEGDAPVVVCVPAMGVRASFYTPLAEALGDCGLHVVCMDHRGAGMSQVRAARGVSFGYAELVGDDLPAVVRATKDRFPGRPIHLLGHSLGGQLSAIFMGAYPRTVDGVILVAACSVYFKSYPFPHDVKVLAAASLFRGVARVVGYFPGHRLGFGGREARGVMEDWSTQALTGRYAFHLGGEAAEDLLARADGRVLAVSVAGDSLAPPSAVDHLCSKLRAARVARWHYEPAASTPRLDHFRWVKHPRAIANYVRRWIDDQHTA